MPLVEEMLKKIGQTQFRSILDLTKGYWQIPMVPTDKGKTAFGTIQGLFKFQYMPF